eukprot:1158116-Pelagomonas_calceolata.AAC.8
MGSPACWGIRSVMRRVRAAARCRVWVAPSTRPTAASTAGTRVHAAADLAGCPKLGPLSFSTKTDILTSKLEGPRPSTDTRYTRAKDS